jgi:hypothetical protein
MKDGLKHFLVVGIGFAFVLGWLLTFVVNAVIGTAIASFMLAPATSSYAASLLLTLISVALITGAAFVGNRVLHHRAGVRALSTLSLFVSTALMALLVLAFVTREFVSLLDIYTSNTSYFYSHGSELAGAISLPLARLLLIPSLYFLVGRLAFPRRGV